MKYRICYRKLGAMKFVSHLDMQRTLQRAFRRAGLKTVFSQGFNPHLKMSYTPPLALFATSDEEYLDIELTGEELPQQVYDKLSGVLPAGIIINSVKKLAPDDKALSALYTRAAYEIVFSCVPDADKAAADTERFYNGSEEIIITKLNKKHKEKQTDIKKQIFSFKATSNESAVTVNVVLSCTNDNLLNPFVLVGALRENVPSLAQSSIKKVHKLYVE